MIANSQQVYEVRDGMVEPNLSKLDALPYEKAPNLLYLGYLRSRLAISRCIAHLRRK